MGSSKKTKDSVTFATEPLSFFSTIEGLSPGRSLSILIAF